jgi:hypothetical protein
LQRGGCVGGRLFVLVQAAADGADLTRKSSHAMLVLGVVLFRRGGASLATDPAIA